ncbi:MAG: hypothetical protein EP318_15530 [Rhodobacteraceae bacterium]|nr:MAG: hypothetical protein EP318_15530 [Paracoccaceae bacterium]
MMRAFVGTMVLIGGTACADPLPTSHADEFCSLHHHHLTADFHTCKTEQLQAFQDVETLHQSAYGLQDQAIHYCADSHWPDWDKVQFCATGATADLMNVVRLVNEIDAEFGVFGLAAIQDHCVEPWNGYVPRLQRCVFQVRKAFREDKRKRQEKRRESE